MSIGVAACLTPFCSTIATGQGFGRSVSGAHAPAAAIMSAAARPFVEPWQRLLLNASATSNAAAGSIIAIPTPASSYVGCSTAYTSCTNLMPISAADFSTVSSLNDGTLMVQFSTDLEARTVPQSWRLWNSPPATESSTLRVLLSPGTTPSSIILTFSQPLLTFGLEAQPDRFGVIAPITETFFNGTTSLGSISQDVSADGGALLFAATVASPSTPITSVSVTGAGTVTDFAIGQLRYRLATPANGDTLRVTAPCPAQSGTVGVPYSFPITATGGVGTLSWTRDSSLPPGLALNPDTGTISGTPTQSGSYNVSIVVTDSQRQSATYSCAINIVSPSRLNLTASCPAAAGVQGSPYSFAVTATGGGGALNWQLISGSLPLGLMLNPATGAITGIPGASGTFPISIRVTDSAVGTAAQTATYTCNIVVGSPVTPPLPSPDVTFTSGCPASTAALGSLYAQTLLASGGNGRSFTFSISQGALPPGLRLFGDQISGTPSGPLGVTRFSIQVSSGDATTQLACSITVTGPQLQLTSGCPANGTQGVLYTPFLLGATGGSGPGTYTFSVVGGSLPAGLNPLQIAGSCPAAPVPVNAAVSLPLSASGGSGNYTWSVSGSSFLSLSSTSGSGVTLSGTPTVVGPVSFTVTLSDSAGSAVATFSCTLQVSAALQLTASGTCPASPLDFQAAVSIGLSVSGGTAPYRYTYSGSPFLSLSSTTGATTTVSGSATSAGPASFSVTVTDSANTPSASFGCSFTVRPAVVPPISVAVSSAISLTPAGVVISLGAPAPQDLTGTVTLSFKSTATNPLDSNPQVHFSNPSGTTFTFTIPKGSQNVTLPAVEQGSVAGTIHLQITDLRAGTDSVLPPASVFADIVVPGLKPVITNQFPSASPGGVSFENESATGFDVVISGYSTPRDMTSVTLVFTPKSGATLEGDSTFTVSVANLFTSYYQSPRATAAGSIFTGLRIPVTISGDKDVIGSVTVTLTNSVGTSDAISKSR